MTSAPTYRITTLGCRVNFAETREIESLLLQRGLRPARRGDPADLEIVHTCTVTNRATAKSRQAIRRAVRRGGGADAGRSIAHEHAPSPGRGGEVIVTGCAVSTDRRAIDRIAGPLRAIPHDGDDGSPMLRRLEARIDGWLATGPRQETIRPAPAGSSGGELPLPVVEPRPGAGAHLRAEIKIQDGCDAHCSFCIIPRIRRTLRSKTPADAVLEARQLVDLGHREIVLSGIFIGAYGHETALRRRQRRPGRGPLADLLDAVARVPGLERLRISSMEPGDVDEALLDAMLANAPVVVPHLHLPLQSGSDAILRRMNRQYRVGDYLEMIERVNAALTTADGLPPALTTDIICGFPGETEGDFERTLAIAQRVGYLHMHVFPFSPRRGTAAARWSDRFVDPLTVRRRVRRLIALEEDPDEGLSIAFRRRLLGRTVRVILEQTHPDGNGELRTGRCDHYALVTVRTGQPRGTLFPVRVTGVTADATTGRPVAAALRLPVLVH